ncbi:MAG: prepilin-type N-terminal cleavage/methylation domain-containing protein [Armatimonadota bacterium]
MQRHGLTLVEFLVVLAIVAVLASFLFPIFSRTRSHPQVTCTSNVRQLSTAVQMYNQDNQHRYPGRNWNDATLTYVGSQKIFFCPEDKKAGVISKPVSYGYNGLLLRADGTGCSEAQVISPTEIGAICDAMPSKEWSAGAGIIGGGGLCHTEEIVAIAPRHTGVVMGYCDGHAKFFPGKQPGMKDQSNPISRAFFQANALGLIDNPAGGLHDFTPLRWHNGGFVIDGDPCTRPLLKAAAEAWRVKASAHYHSKGFLGQYATDKRPMDFLWGTADGVKPAGNAIAIARDAMVVIVSRQTKLTAVTTQQYLLTRNQLVTLFTDQGGFVDPDNPATSGAARVVYTFNTRSGSRAYLEHQILGGVAVGNRAKVVKDDREMTNTVAADPYGVGYCSAAFTDPDKVRTLDYRYANGVVAHFPSDDPKHPSVYPANPTWPFIRTLYAVCGGNTWRADGAGIGNVMLAPDAPGTRALRDGPLFQASYWAP